MRRAVFALLMMLTIAGSAWAQSQAINGSIEGVVTDVQGGLLPGVTVTLTNTDTGATRSTTTNEEGLYRAVLLPLGRYAVVAELAGFKKSEQTGITLAAGQSVVVNVVMALGSVQETVQVIASTPITDPARVELGRTITNAEFANLPLVSRNSFNFGLLQPNVTGYEDVEFGATRVNANGSQMRTNYQIDGSSATQKNRAGLRMFQPSEIMVREVKVTSSGFAPEFGQTTGMVYNVITPSGTNQYRGDASYRFRRKDFAARPFTLAATAPKPDTHVDDAAVTFGGPILRDRLHFFGGYEYVKKDLSADRVITVTPATAATLGLSADALGAGVVPAIQTVNMFVGKADYQLSVSNRLSARWSVFNNVTPENIGSTTNNVPNTREVAYDFQDRMDNVGIQLTSSIGNNKLNEFRLAYGRRDNPFVASAVSGPGPSISITGVANFNGVRFAPNTPVFVEDYVQAIDNFSYIRGAHNFKVGFDAQWINDERGADMTALYTFPNVAAYLAAKNGTNRLGYTSFQQNVGDPSLSYSQSYLSVFAQDDWRLSAQLKVLFGLRYDVFNIPEGDASAPLAISQSFRTDKNNVGPRVGIAWSVDPSSRTVVRASTGLMYESPLGAFYENALLQNGNPRLASFSGGPTAAGAPLFPATVSGGATPSRSLFTVDPAFDTQYAWISDLQVEHAVSNSMSVSAAYLNSTGRHLPYITSVNVVAGANTLADGRPVYSTARLDPRFDFIRQVESKGRSRYNALTLGLNQRLTEGLLFNAFYTLAKAEDNAPIGGDYVVGSIDRPGLSDPSNPERDFGYTAWNQTHTFVLTTVYSPKFAGDGFGAAIANNNQVGVVIQANSGLPYNITARTDLNLDGIAADRPVGVDRNDRTLGAFATVDLRYSRFVPLGGFRRVEAIAEFKNLLNRKNIRAVNAAMFTDAAGKPTDAAFNSIAIPDAFPITQTYEPRQFQLGVKVTF
jgi:hypothetical protein